MDNATLKMLKADAVWNAIVIDSVSDVYIISNAVLQHYAVSTGCMTVRNIVSKICNLLKENERTVLWGKNVSLRMVFNMQI